MPKKGAAKRRRQRFISSDIRAPAAADADAMATTSSAAHTTSARRARNAQRVEEAPAVMAAMRAAEETAEVYLPGLPPNTAPRLVANALRRALHTMRLGTNIAGCVLKVTVKAVNGESDAWALLWAREAADRLIAAPPIPMFERAIKVCDIKKSVVGAGGTKIEPGAKRFPIGLVEVGELKRAPAKFSSFWKSETHFKVKDDYVEVNPVSRVIAITLSRKLPMWRGDPKLGTFERFESVMRLEIPFRYIVAAAEWHKSSRTATHTAFYFRIAHPPRIFRQAELTGEAPTVRDEASFSAQRSRTWDFEVGETLDVHWLRTIDPTAPAPPLRHAPDPTITGPTSGAAPQSSAAHMTTPPPPPPPLQTAPPNETAAFSRASGIRVFLDMLQSLNFFNELKNMGIVDHMPFIPPVVGSRLVTSAVNLSTLLANTASHFYNIPFSVRYEVECLVGFGALLPSELEGNALFWEILAGLEETGALSVLDLMNVFAQTEEGYTLLDPVAALTKAMDMQVMDVNADSGGRADRWFPTSPSRVITGAAIGPPRESCPDPGNGAALESEPRSDRGVAGDEEFMMETFSRPPQLSGTPSKLNRRSSGSRSRSSSPRVSRGRGGGEDEATILDPSMRRSKAESHQARIRRLLVTPTRVVAYRADSDLLNRVLREFKEHSDRFIRAVFGDEDGNSVAYISSSDVLAKVRQVLGEGVVVGGERFVFLACSASQLREHGCWMYNETESPHDTTTPPTAAEIRAWMGDFSTIRTASKYAARMGQTFSSSVGTVKIHLTHQGKLDDIWDARKEYNFSDGVGVMSEELGRFISKKLRLRFKGPTPSAFQIRFAGAKGMLTCWDSVLPAGKEVLLRPSMVKFESVHRALEIVGHSKRLTLLLNRQMIMHLSSLGVPSTVFLKLQKGVLKRLDAAMKAGGADDALNLLYTAGYGALNQKLDNLAPMLDAAAMFRAGLVCTNCEFLFDIMTAFRRRILGEIIAKARIPIGITDGCAAIGVLDEVKVLGPSEIFLQYTHPVSREIIVVEGPVVVGRSPCMHPGDMQPLTAVFHEKLSHLVDVVVFPQVGDRPIPSMLSGGDLEFSF